MCHGFQLCKNNNSSSCSKKLYVEATHEHDCVFQRALHLAGGLEVQVKVESRLTGEELIQEANSVPAACRATVWIYNTTATVMQIAWSGTDL